jgi:hypothetical protein
MTMQSGVCPNCGADIRASARFCVKCGKSIETLQPPQVPPIPTPLPPAVPIIPPPPVPEPMIPPPTPVSDQGVPLPPPVSIPSIPQSSPLNETVLTVIGQVERKKGFLGVSADLFHMVITNERLIFALQTSEMIKLDVQNARAQAKLEGKNVFGQIGAQMATRSGDKYLSSSPDQILMENPNNFMIPLSVLKVIETYSGGFGEDNAPDTMVIKTLSDKITFVVGNAMVVHRELKAVLGDRVK